MCRSARVPCVDSRHSHGPIHSGNSDLPRAHGTARPPRCSRPCSRTFRALTRKQRRFPKHASRPQATHPSRSPSHTSRRRSWRATATAFGRGFVWTARCCPRPTPRHSGHHRRQPHQVGHRRICPGVQGDLQTAHSRRLRHNTATAAAPFGRGRSTGLGWRHGDRRRAAKHRVVRRDAECTAVASGQCAPRCGVVADSTSPSTAVT